MGSFPFPIPSKNPIYNVSFNRTASLLAANEASVTTAQQNIQNVVKNSDPTTFLGLGLFTSIGIAEDGQGRGSLANILRPKGGNGLVNIVKEFPWTISNTANRDDIPYIELKEHIIDGGRVQKQISFYLDGVREATRDVTGGQSRGTLDVYDEIFIRNPSNWRYKFPYFSKVQYELATAAWEQFDKIGEAVSGLTSGIAQGLKGLGFSGTAALTESIGGIFRTAQAVAETGLKFKYPIVNIADRPRIFTTHNERSITIQFPLYNTISELDWQKNREFLTLFQSQNLFNKRNFITGLPPVWYEVYVPNQYYSVASCVTNIRVENLGNIRKEKIRGIMDVLVPDAYQVEITLQEMAMPSKNQFHSALGSKHPFDRVNASAA